MDRLTTDSFIAKARKKHGHKYDYSQVKYVHSHDKVTLVCPEHGLFKQLPDKHLRGNGCPECYRSRRRWTADSFIEKARSIHGDKYDYSRVEYSTSQAKVTITCPEHGSFAQRPNSHLRGSGCPSCSLSASTIDSFIAKARKRHGDKYNYSQVGYSNNRTKVTIVCPEHGPFKQRPFHHLKGQGCPECGTLSRGQLTTDSFIQKARSIHGDKYDYSHVKYVHSNAKVTIICPKHGPFEQAARSHRQGNGCPACGQLRTHGLDPS